MIKNSTNLYKTYIIKSKNVEILTEYLIVPIEIY